MTVLRGCVGCRTVAVPATATARDLKERIFAETGFPVAEQRLWRGDREVGGLPGLPPPPPQEMGAVARGRQETLRLLSVTED